jgi:hypothetical protein
VYKTSLVTDKVKTAIIRIRIATGEKQGRVKAQFISAVSQNFDDQ